MIHGRSSRVAPETVERINGIIRKYNYTPNMSARALVNKSSRIIGVINHLIPHVAGSFLVDPFHGAILGGIESKLREYDYHMMIRTVENEDELISLFGNWNFDGVILTGLFNDRFFEKLMDMGKPILLLDSYIDNEKILSVRLEDFRGGYLAAKHLIGKGHRDIVFASPPIHPQGVIHERFLGFQSALKEADIPLPKKNIYEQEIHIDDGKSLGHRLSERRDISAVVTTADILAAGIMAGLREKGVKIPDDISLIGFDDVDISRLTYPQLTTIHQDIHLRGQLAAGLLVDSLEGKKGAKRRLTMPVSLVERESVRSLTEI